MPSLGQADITRLSTLLWVHPANILGLKHSPTWKLGTMLFLSPRFFFLVRRKFSPLLGTQWNSLCCLSMWITWHLPSPPVEYHLPPLMEGNEVFTVEEGWVRSITQHRPWGGILAMGDQSTDRRWTCCLSAPFSEKSVVPTCVWSHPANYQPAGDIVGQVCGLLVCGLTVL